MIHRWDLNNDGFLDLLVGQSHNQVDNEDAMIYWGSKTGPRSILPPLPEHQPLGRLLRQIRERDSGVTRLPSDGGGRCLTVDLNGDGWLELVFCNYIHNYNVHMDAFIYWGSSSGYSERRLTRLPTLMAKGVAAADFNGDGFVDLAFANEGIETGQRFGYTENLESYIYWNGPRGFSPDRRTILPTISATDCAAGDLNGDDRPELVFINHNQDHSSISIFWNGKDGLKPSGLQRWKTGTPLGVEIFDVNRDDLLDVLLLDQDNYAEIFLGTGDNFDREPWVKLTTAGAVECRASDLNKDGSIDLVFPNPGTKKTQASMIYWGSPAGFKSDRRKELPTLQCADVAVADFNGDGWDDLAFANQHDGQSYDINSYLYWNGSHGFQAAHRDELQGFGAIAVAAADLNTDGHPDLLMINRYSGTTDANHSSPGSLIYWGNPRAYYSTASVSHLPTTEDTMAAADLNQDGFVDLAFPNGHLYWGGADGYQPQRRQELDVKGNGTSVADLNRDGYLDLILPTGSAIGENPSSGWILWGNVDGYRVENRTELPLTTRYSQSAAVADLNKDGYLDLIFPDVDSPQVDFFWGNATGDYKAQAQHSQMKIHSASTLEIADLNTDGWLDLVFGGVYDPNNFGRPLREANILWGGPKGFSVARSLTLEAFESEEQAVADLNQDGFLDIVMSNYHGYTTRSLPLFVYWGNAGASYSVSRRSELPAESALGLTVADLNGDAWYDLVVFNHQERGDHGVGANIFWGGQKGYSYQRRHWFQTFGVHFTVRRDIGNIYDRKLVEEYISAPIRRPHGNHTSRLRWRATTPHGTAVRFQIRSAVDEKQLTDSSWSGPQGPEGFYENSDTVLTGLDPEHAWLQYRAILSTPNGGNTPYLEEVRIATSE